MHPALKTAMASALALATVAPAAAQNDPGGSPYRPTDAYAAQQREYEAQRDVYRDQSADYRAARADYERRLADWQARRADYDARYGYGAYARAYPAPAWDDRRWASAPPSADYRAARADYERRLADWQARSADYDARYGYGAYARAYGPAPVWDDRRWASAPPAADYRAARADYERRLADWQARSADYDARYGYGAYARAYGPAPVWDDQRWAAAAPSADYRAARADYERRLADWQARSADYDTRYGNGAYARAYGPAPVWDDQRWASAPPAAGYYGRDTAYTAPIRCNNNSAVTAGIIGALAGSVLGSNVAARGRRTEGAVLGGVVGAGLGAVVGHANDKYKCDEQGAYWSYNDTVPYRVSSDVYPDDRYAYYSSRRCRLAPAPVNDTDYRYVRVCPDANGRYRVTG